MNANRKEIARFRAQVNQRIPLHQVQIPTILNQQELINDILFPNLKHNAYYVKSVLTKFIKLYESSNVDIEDEIYDLLSTVLSAKELAPTDTDVVSYYVGGFSANEETEGSYISVRESPRIISGAGTTGLRTWEAALYFSNYLMDRKYELLENKRVLELGTGTGLVGMTLGKFAATIIDQVTLTDGDSSLIENLNHSFKLNDIEYSDNILIKSQRLWWGEDECIPENDLIVAADVTYDETIVSSLAYTIKKSFESTRCTVALIAATVRNQNTIKKWEMTLTEYNLKWEIVDKCENPDRLDSICWYQSCTPEIRIYRITR